MADAGGLLRSQCELLVAPLDLEAGRRALEEAKQRTLWQMLTDSAHAGPDHKALVGGDDAGNVTRVTYRELVERAKGLSAGLASIGVRRGDRVVL
jgi:fatty-acyl-CoA synthase